MHSRLRMSHLGRRQPLRLPRHDVPPLVRVPPFTPPCNVGTSGNNPRQVQTIRVHDMLDFKGISGRWRTVSDRSLAEGVGFEPTLRFPVNTLSKRAPSATRPPLRTALPEGAHPPSGRSTSAEDGLFSRRCAIGPVRWGGTIVATIGLTRHCRNRRVGSSGQLSGRRSPGYPDQAASPSASPSCQAAAPTTFCRPQWTNPSTIIWCAPIHAIPG